MRIRHIVRASLATILCSLASGCFLVYDLRVCNTTDSPVAIELYSSEPLANVPRDTSDHGWWRVPLSKRVLPSFTETCFQRVIWRSEMYYRLDAKSLDGRVIFREVFDSQTQGKSPPRFYIYDQSAVFHSKSQNITKSAGNEEKRY